MSRAQEAVLDVWVVHCIIECDRNGGLFLDSAAHAQQAHVALGVKVPLAQTSASLTPRHLLHSPARKSSHWSCPFVHWRPHPLGRIVGKANYRHPPQHAPHAPPYPPVPPAAAVRSSQNTGAHSVGRPLLGGK